jgi:hypothetical protein
MDKTLDQGLSRLAAGEFLRIRDGIGQTLAVFDGFVWITQESDPCDAFVAKGETFTLYRPGLAVIEAVTDARVAVLAARAEVGAEHENAFA